MSRYTLWRSGLIAGTYPGATEDEAFTALAKEEGYKDKDAMFKAMGLTSKDVLTQHVPDEPVKPSDVVNDVER